MFGQGGGGMPIIAAVRTEPRRVCVTLVARPRHQHWSACELYSSRRPFGSLWPLAVADLLVMALSTGWPESSGLGQWVAVGRGA